MTVVLTSPVEGLQPGANYTGTREAFLLANGYARQTGYDTDVAAKITGGSNAVNIVTGGNLVVVVGNTVTTVALTAADTPAAAATKIDTALAGKADAAIASGKLEITTNKVGSLARIEIRSGTGTVLANLGLGAGQSAIGAEGGIGIANTGPVDQAPSASPKFNATRGQIAANSDLPAGGTNDGIVLKANPNPTTTFGS